MSVCTRFAPSPTGTLHIGGARTALYCWLYAKKHQGQFLLRIEDTDKERSTQASIDAIFEAMAWLGLEHDHAPVYQTQRFDRYRKIMQQWLAEGKAYRCYCSKERLASLREQQLASKEKPRYDGHCRHTTPPADLDPNAAYVVRFANPQTGDVCVQDVVKGQVIFNNAELDDLIIWRSDDTPTYNFTVVIDDADMHITHVIRGDDHLNNTPRQMNMLQALNAPVPVYAHVSMILGKDGKRLSKRHGATGVMQYRDEGFLPEALLNYLVRLGWSCGDQEIFSLDELINLFDLTHINKAAAAFDPDKLLWLNQHYIKTLPTEQLIEPLQWQFDQLGINTSDGASLTQIIEVQKDRAKTLREMAEQSRFFFETISSYDEKAQKKHLTLEAKAVFDVLIPLMQHLDTWEKEPLHALIKQTAEQLNVKMGKVAQPIRVALTGNTISPSIDITLTLIGREKTLLLLSKAAKVCQG